MGSPWNYSQLIKITAWQCIIFLPAAFPLLVLSVTNHTGTGWLLGLAMKFPALTLRSHPGVPEFQLQMALV